MYDSSKVPRLLIGTLILSGFVSASEQTGFQYPSIPYELAHEHELKPHRHVIPLAGVNPGFNKLRIRATISPDGRVTDAKAYGDDSVLAYWPEVRSEVLSWRFLPFEDNGKPRTVEIEEYVGLAPVQRFPTDHVLAPRLGSDSEVSITLQRNECYGSCPSYEVTLDTQQIKFDGRAFVIASHVHTERARAEQVRRLAQKFIDADFYSMDERYAAASTDLPTYILRISINGQSKEVVDYQGVWVGMPEVIAELEDEVDRVARTGRFIEGEEGLVQQLREERFDFTSHTAQVLLTETASRGKTATVRELLRAGVTVNSRAEKPGSGERASRFDNGGILTAASGHSETLELLINAGASRHNQVDKDLALGAAARAGSVEAVRDLIAYGANPNGDLSYTLKTTTGLGIIYRGYGAGSILIYAAESGNPQVVREILRYKPKLEAKDQQGRTALFAASQYRSTDRDGARAGIVSLLVNAGADVNARDIYGNTPLHETFLTDVAEELLKLGADVNARNLYGETPIFTTVNDHAIPLFIRYGADLSIRNKAGQTVLEAARTKGPSRRAALSKAIREAKGPK